MRRKLRMLAWCDSPLSITGFGVVAKNILGRIYKTGMFDLACVGINHFEEHFDKAFEDRSDVPYKVFIGQDTIRQGLSTQAFDPMGRAKTIAMLKSSNIDIFFCMRDLWDMVFQQAQGRPYLESYLPFHIQLAKEQGHNFRVLSHFPLEYQVQPNWKPALDMMDYGYCFTAGGMPQLEPYSDKIAWCPQGADTEVFRPLNNFNKSAFKEQKMKINPNSFVVLCVQRNQPRKDIPATIEAFAKFKQTVGEGDGKRRPVLWLHMRPDDSFGDAREAVQKNGLQVDHDVFFPPNFNVGAGWSEQELNMLYNASDVFISTSVAEGFGLTPVEAGCAGLPVLVAGHTGHLQTMSQLGMPYVACKPPETREKVAPSPISPTDTDDMARHLVAHYEDPTKLQKLVKQNITKFRKTFSWDEIFNEYWLPVLETIQEDIFGTEARQKNNSDRFLFVCEEAAGDIAAGATPAIAALKQRYPEVPIDFMSKNHFSSIVDGMPEIDSVLRWDLNKIYDYPKDRVFYPHAKIRHGNWSSGWSHLMDMQSEMIGLQPGDPYLNTKEFDLKLDNMDGSVPDLITIHTTSQGGKMIAPDKWVQLIKGILQKYPDIRFAQIGGKEDMMVPGTLDYRGLPFEEQAWLQSISFCHIGIDSSPMHFAQIVGQPSITFWGWTNPEVCKARKGAIHIAAHHATVCPKFGPCHGVQPTCGINQYDTKSAMGAPCVRSINVDPAIEIVNRALEMGIDVGRKWLWEQGTNSKTIYSIPALRIESEEKRRARPTLVGVK